MLAIIREGRDHHSFISLSLSPPPLCRLPHHLTRTKYMTLYIITTRSISTKMNLILHLSVIKLGLLSSWAKWENLYGHLHLMILRAKGKEKYFQETNSFITVNSFGCEGTAILKALYMCIFFLDFHSDAVISRNNIITERNPIFFDKTKPQIFSFQMKNPCRIYSVLFVVISSEIQDIFKLLTEKYCTWQVIFFLTYTLWFQTMIWTMSTSNTCTFPS